MDNPANWVGPDGREPEITVDLPEVTIIGQKVMEPISGFGDVFGYYLYGRTIAFPMYNINNNGMSSNPIGHITCNVTNKGRLY